ncbi:hypothetical protein ACFQ05_14460 [Amycolatopsis umgeniensis]|uniref:Uncharacterized protein n=1 Tax=Amycolatopsis umgeniensis TaxID=336628 RepID=A0A841B7H6_9PSEU|nr:hypothetical protein [Amycolatopsis umgeniensis]MBB5854508.1 hypothetical protein [Amycolatopsis umgeniensis]
MADETKPQDKSVSGVVPVQFSADAETHDVAVVATNREVLRRSPFGADVPLRAASGE